MPAWTAFAPLRRPFDADIGLLPQSEIKRVFLLLANGDAGAGFQILNAIAAEFAIVRDIANAKIDVAITRIGRAFSHEVINILDDLRHVNGGFWGDIGL